MDRPCKPGCQCKHCLRDLLDDAIGLIKLMKRHLDTSWLTAIAHDSELHRRMEEFCNDERCRRFQPMVKDRGR